MAIIKIVSIGMFDVPSSKPFYVGLALKDGDPPAIQPMTRPAFFALLNGLIAPTVQACGFTHVPTVTIPDDQLAANPLEPASRIIKGH